MINCEGTASIMLSYEELKSNFFSEHFNTTLELGGCATRNDELIFSYSGRRMGNCKAAITPYYLNSLTILNGATQKLY